MDAKTRKALCALLGLDASKATDEQIRLALEARNAAEGGGSGNAGAPILVQELGLSPDGKRALVRFAIEIDSAFAKKSAGDAGAAELPTELHVIPDGPRVFARDGRRFKISDPEGVIRASETPALIDWEHLSEFHPLWGGTSKAAGWLSGYAHVEGKGIVATVEKWTPDGARDVGSATYRYLSPVLSIDAETEEVLQIHSVALTNTPALRLDSIEQFRTALSRGGFEFRPSPRASSPEETTMDPKTKKALCSMLGLDPTTVTDEQLRTALEAFHAKQGTAGTGAVAPVAPVAPTTTENLSLIGETVSLVAYNAVVTERNDFQARALKAEAELAEANKGAFRKKVEDAFAAAAAEGHVTPAEREFELDRIQTQADLDKAITAWSKRPKLGAAPSGQGGGSDNAFRDAKRAADAAANSNTAPGAFSKDQEAFLKRTGIKPEQFAAAADARRSRSTTQET